MSERLQSKVFYTPLEAAIRWAGLLKYEPEILRLVPEPKNPQPKIDCPHWSQLRLYLARIYDAIVNGDLRYGRDGITQDNPSLWECPDLTVRHVDLKKWIQDYYPEHRPAFLFSRAERLAYPAISLEAGQTLLVELRAKKTELALRKQQFRELQGQHQELLKQYERTAACHESPVSDRAEGTYQNIIGAMLDVLLGQSPAGTPYSVFRSQDAVIAALIGHYGGVMSITERTLKTRFAQSLRRVRDAATHVSVKNGSMTNPRDDARHSPNGFPVNSPQ